MEIVAKCEKCGREFVSIPDHVTKDAYGRFVRDIDSYGKPIGPRRTEICGGEIIRYDRAKREQEKA